MGDQELKFFMLVGLPGAGKSTYAGYLAAETGARTVVFDDICDSMVSVPTSARDVDLECWRRMREVLDSGHSVILDGLNASRPSRAEGLSLVPAGVSRICVYIRVPIEVARARIYERAAAGGHDVHHDILFRVHCVLAREPPMLAEGFNELWILDPEHNLVSVTGRE